MYPIEQEPIDVEPSAKHIFEQWIRAGGFGYLPCLKEAYTVYYQKGWTMGERLLAAEDDLLEGRVTAEEALGEYTDVLVGDGLTEEQMAFLKALPTHVATAFITHAIQSGQLDAQLQKKTIN